MGCTGPTSAGGASELVDCVLSPDEPEELEEPDELDEPEEDPDEDPLEFDPPDFDPPAFELLPPLDVKGGGAVLTATIELLAPAEKLPAPIPEEADDALPELDAPLPSL